MKWNALVGGIAGVACLLAVSSASAQEPFDSKLQAAVFNTKLVQALDECDSPTTVISGLSACTPGNVNTDGTPFNTGKLLVKSKAVATQVLAILKSSGNSGDNDNKKALAGKNLRVQLTLRVTRRSAGLPNPAATFSDITLTCGTTSPPVPENGNFIYKGTLAGATGCNLPVALAGDATLKEVVAAAIIDGDTGLPVAVPGVRKK